jgi:hypothetical protein
MGKVMNVVSNTVNFTDFGAADMSLADRRRYAVLSGGFNGY